MRCLTFIFLFCVAIAARSEAGLIERDLFTLGDGLLTYDEVNEREWLDLTETLDWSFAALQEATGPDGPLSGFQLATLDDVVSFAAGGGVTWQATANFPGANGRAAWNMINLTGELTLWADDDPDGSPCCDFDDLHEFDILQILGTRLAAGFAMDNSGLSSSEGLLTAAVFSYGEPAVPLNSPLYQPGEHISGGITRIANADLGIEIVSGPYWLYRSVPEPNTLFLILGAALVSVRIRRAGR